MVKTGPKLVLGSFKRDFFNLTELSIYPRYELASGQHLFIFNQVVDKEVIEFKIKQQLYKALAIEFLWEIDLGDQINDDDKLINPVFDLSCNRRAYKASIFYKFDDEVGGLNFKI